VNLRRRVPRSLSADRESTRLREVSRLFVTLGVIGFGGPAAHIAMMRDEVVRRRAWVSDEEFLESVAVVNLIPGPNSTELAMHLGATRAGRAGLFVGGLCFIAPAVLIVSALAFVYERYATSPTLIDLRVGILPVVLAIVAHAFVPLARTLARDRVSGTLAAASFAAYLLEVHELLVLCGAGLIASAAITLGRGGGGNRGAATSASAARRLRSAIPAVLSTAASSAEQSVQRATVTLWRLFAVFLEIGSVLYGSGYVLIAFLQRNLVDERAWMTTKELLDAVTIGQVTPGPVFTTATFIGWQLAGARGAAVATVGIFAPSFLFVGIIGRVVRAMRARPAAAAFLRGVTAASLGMMAGVLVDLTRSAITDVFAAALALVALGVLLKWRLNSAWLIAAGALIGLARSFL
jgi:chromate transporter